MKKQMSKVIGMLGTILIAVMMFGVVSFAGGNGGDFTISAGSKSANVGDTISVSVGTYAVTANTLTGGFAFDKTLFEVTSIKEDYNDFFVVSTVAEANSVGRVGFAIVNAKAPKAFAAGSKLITVQLKAKKGGNAVLSLYEDSDLDGSVTVKNDSYGDVVIAISEKADGIYKDSDNKWKYYENGVFTASTGMAKRITDGKWLYVEKGVFKKVTGMVKRISDGKWFYVEKGVFNNKATGVVKRVSDSKLFYVAKGKYDNKFTGTAADLSGKNIYYVTKGQVKAVTDVLKDGSKWKYFVKGKFTASTGVVARSKDKKWVYINKGVVTASTGMAKRLTDNKWVYVEKGVLSKKTGLVQRISDKKWFYVQKGVYNNKYTGGVQRISDKKWFYVAKGQLNKATGIAKCMDGKYRYFKNGSFNKLTGKAKLIGTNKVYKVKNGMLVK